MKSLPHARRTILFTALFTSLALSLASCGGKGNESTNTVAMKDLEVVDGTASDAMTDLDGVKSEGTAMMPSNASGAASATRSKSGGNATESADNAADTEVIADQ